jgi:hypothetical protein
MRHALIPLAALVLSGCATIVQTPHQSVEIRSVPKQADVTINGRPFGHSPVTARLARGKEHLVRIEYPGYEPYEMTLTRTFSGWVWGNVVFGGLPGLVVDALTGSMFRLTPEQVSAELRQGGARTVATGDVLHVAVTLAPDPDWEYIGTLEPTGM